MQAFFFEAVVTVNLTALLVLTTLFISVSGTRYRRVHGDGFQYNFCPQHQKTFIMGKSMIRNTVDNKSGIIMFE